MHKQKGEVNTMVIAGVIILLLALIGGFFILQRRNQSAVQVTTEVTESPTEAVEETPTTEPTQSLSPTETAMEKAEPMKVVMNADAKSGSNQKGTATLTEIDGKVKVALTLTGYESAVAQPAHIHAGTCTAPGKIVYPLNDVVDGKSETTVNTTLTDLKKQLPLIINVHKSASELTVYTSCGDLK